MLFRKKKKIKVPESHHICDCMVEELTNAGKAVRECVREMLVRKNVIDLYPEGRNKNAVMVQYKKKQEILISAINEYDFYRIKLINFYNRNYMELQTHWAAGRIVGTMTGEEVVEDETRDFLERG